MKKILEFSTPEENEEFNLHNNGPKYARVLSELDNFLRNKTKYAPDFQSDEITEIYQEIRDKLFEFLSDEDISV